MDTQLHKKNKYILNLLIRTFKKYNSDNLNQTSAQLAYFAILSIFPFLVFINALIGRFHISIGSTLSDIGLFLPSNISEILLAYIRHLGDMPTTNLLSIGLISTIYLASKTSKSFIRALDIIYKNERKMSFLKLNIISILITVSLGLTVLIAIFALTLGGNIVTNILNSINVPIHYANTWIYMRWTILIILVVINLWMIYYFLPTKKASIFHVLPGTILATILFMVMSFFFSLYVNNYANYDVIYGSLGGIVVFMLWLHVGSSTLLIGACLNYIMYCNFDNNI